MTNSKLSVVSLAALGVGLLFFNWGIYAAKQSPEDSSFNAQIIVAIILLVAAAAGNIYGLAKRKSSKKEP